MNRWSKLAAIAATQHQLVTVADARGCGIPESTLHRRGQAEGWLQVHRGVWALPGVPLDDLRSHAGALLVSGADAVLARRSAAWLWGLRSTPPPVPEILIPARRSTTRRDGVRVLRSTTLSPDDLTTSQHLPLTRPARTIADLARVNSEERVLALILTARQRGLVTPAEMADQAWNIGNAPGSRRLRRALALGEGEAIDSILEHEIRRGIAATRLPPPLPGPMWLAVPGGRRLQLDIPWPDLRVAIEADGLAFHQTHEDLTRDHHKQNVAATLDWIVMRCGYWRWRRDARGFLLELGTVLARRTTATLQS